MPHKDETERPLRMEDGIYYYVEPHTHVTKKNRHRHIKDGKKGKKQVFIPVKDIQSISLEETEPSDVPDICLKDQGEFTCTVPLDDAAAEDIRRMLQKYAEYGKNCLEKGEMPLAGNYDKVSDA